MWGKIGNYLDGWAKFAMTIAALGWVGLQAADRYAPRSATVTIGQSESTANRATPDVVQTVAYEQPAQTGAEASASVVNELAREITLAFQVLATNSLAQLVAALAIGVTGGLVLRPKVNKWRESRAVKAARRRADRHAADLRLLAANDAKGNVHGPSAIQPMKRH